MSDRESRARSHELIELLNAWWPFGGPNQGPPTLRSRLATPVRNVFERFLKPQENFNSYVVQYINTCVKPLETVRDEMQDELRDHRAVLEAGLEEVRDVRRYQESLAARERRMDQALAAIRAEHEEIRASLGVVRQTQQGLVRRLEQAIAPATTPAAMPSATVAAPVAPTALSSADALTDAYVGFEDAFRGSPDAIRAGLAEYVPVFEGTSDVLDVGCGRGEFLSLLAERGISARGIDLNDAMVGVCRERGVDATRADAVSYLRAQSAASLGGLLAAQVVEHLEPSYLTTFLASAFDALRPGAPIVLETINPACWFAFFESYVRDITHVRPVHPDTLKFLLVASGFERVEIRYRVPYPEHDKLQPLPIVEPLRDVIETVNANADKLNRLLFTHLDYAAIAYRA